MTTLPNLSVIIPCYNEEKYIGKCLESLLANSYPQDRLEIWVVDGMSTDHTRAIVRQYQEKYRFIHLADNAERHIPAGLNIGIRNAKGEIIIRVDAHSTYAQDYLEKCATYLLEYDLDNAGGVLTTMPGADTNLARCIALVLSSRFGVGGSHFRVGVDAPRQVDTLAFGCFRKATLEAVGGFDESLLRNEDIDINFRIKSRGGRVMIFPDIHGYYYAKPNFFLFVRHNFSNGIWVTYPIVLGKQRLSLRHWVPFLFLMGLFFCVGVLWINPPLAWIGFAVILVPYGLVSLYESFKIAARARWVYLFYLPWMFFALHVSYGGGSLAGIFKIVHLSLEKVIKRTRFEATADPVTEREALMELTVDGTTRTLMEKLPIRTFSEFLTESFPQRNPFLRKDKGLFCNFCKWVSLPIAYMLFRLGITANFFDVFGVLYAFVGYYLFSLILSGQKTWALIGIAMILSHVLFDFIDGSIAKARRYSSKIGELLDNVSVDIDRLLFLTLIGLFSRSTAYLIAMVISAFVIIWVVPLTMPLIPSRVTSNAVIKRLYADNRSFLGVRMILGVLPAVYAAVIWFDLSLALVSQGVVGIYIAHALLWLVILIPEYREINLYEGNGSRLK
jgi:glycosyltransferase involved in cell wall biosynthesis/phosphatidylglycerophosphate synthase